MRREKKELRKETIEKGRNKILHITKFGQTYIDE